MSNVNACVLGSFTMRQKLMKKRELLVLKLTHQCQDSNLCHIATFKFTILPSQNLWGKYLYNTHCTCPLWIKNELVNWMFFQCLCNGTCYCYFLWCKRMHIYLFSFFFSTCLRPCEIFKNPLEHTSIEVKDSVKIDSNHMVVVYRRLPNNSVERRIVQGPTLFIPQADEWWALVVHNQIYVNFLCKYIYCRSASVCTSHVCTWRDWKSKTLLQ